MRGLPRELTQNSRSDAGAHNVTGASATRYFDYASALALRNLAAHYGTAMPRYLLAPEVALLLDAERDQRKRLLIETFWNTGGRLNEVLPLTPEDFVLDGPDGRALDAPFAVLHTLKQRRDEEKQKQRGRGRPTREEQAAQREAEANPPRAVPLTDPGYVRRLREYLATVRLRKGERIWKIDSPDTVRTWIRTAVQAAERDGVTFTIRPITTKTFRDSFAMHLVQHGVPKKVIQSMMGHKDEKSTEWYTQVMALDVTRQLGVRFSMTPEDARALVMPGERLTLVRQNYDQGEGG
ncbi:MULTISPECIES: tyrosine-type recombinase/integrase [Enterobacterales]|uniref:tyrosine-type recombinase/integrase n=1 Tax=Enterobacterales TaxID=91347 RepID=UPI0009BCE4CA|nr:MULTISPECIES: tyrosine-type recombinase/integrase [Enterobacterales]MCE2003829.1 site-specific integrase [Enterobacter asburiae]